MSGKAIVSNVHFKIYVKPHKGNVKNNVTCILYISLNSNFTRQSNNSEIIISWEWDIKLPYKKQM